MDDPALQSVIGLYGRDSVRVQARLELDRLRRELHRAAENPDTSEHGLEGFEQSVPDLAEQILLALHRRLGRRLRRVINATGVFLHTNLGRAPLPPEVAAEIEPILTGYCDLELELESGRRGERNRRVAALLEALCGAPSAIVTNNNAAALVLALSALARGREVVVSRGELVEIGGSFRIPDILETAGARLVEVGTTNRTRIDDYRRAVVEETAILLKVEPSNYRIRGFTESVKPKALAALGKELGLVTLADEGSGLLTADTREPLRDHPSLRHFLESGFDLVCGSGDKLLGGPQAGLLLGRPDLV